MKKIIISLSLLIGLGAHTAYGMQEQLKKEVQQQWNRAKLGAAIVITAAVGYAAYNLYTKFFKTSAVAPKDAKPDVGTTTISGNLATPTPSTSPSQGNAKSAAAKQEDPLSQYTSGYHLCHNTITIPDSEGENALSMYTNSYKNYMGWYFIVRGSTTYSLKLLGGIGEFYVDRSDKIGDVFIPKNETSLGQPIALKNICGHYMDIKDDNNDYRIIALAGHAQNITVYLYKKNT